MDANCAHMKCHWVNEHVENIAEKLDIPRRSKYNQIYDKLCLLLSTLNKMANVIFSNNAACS